MAGPPSETAVRRPRDPRLDFFRGAAMFVILIAHIPGNRWTLWIPARFGFSDATEIFVFCSGMASALAFGAVFAARGWLMGAARVALRVWQVYWAHVGVLILTVALLAAIDLHGWGAPGRVYVEEPHVVPLLTRTAVYLPAALTLTYVPGLFDILPMYLVILGLIPLVMAAHRAGGLPAAAALSVGGWLAATLAMHAWRAGPEAAGLAALGRSVAWMALPAEPDGSRPWFFNPFAWQLVFFTGFAFGMGWLPAPPRRRALFGLALAVLALSLPFAWHKLHEGFYTVQGGPAQRWLAEARAATLPLWDKTAFGPLRYVHFLALAYVAWFLVGPRGARLATGWTVAPRDPARRRRAALLAGAAALLALPAALRGELLERAPALAARLDALWPALATDQGAALELVFLAALVALLWALAGDATRAALARDLPARVTPVVMKVGQQSLAVFMASIPLSQLLGLFLDLAGRTVWTGALANLGGAAALIAVAHVASWFKSHPWRAPGRALAPIPAAAGPRLHAAE